jgi:phosphomevalonate kinase
MKLKYQFVVQKVSGKAVAVAVGQDSQNFNGMIKLNESGELIFHLLGSGDLTQQQLLEQFAQQYETTVENIQTHVLEFVEQLRQNDLLSE